MQEKASRTANTGPCPPTAGFCQTHFRPVSGLARIEAFTFPWPSGHSGLSKASRAYRCGGSTGLVRNERTGFPFHPKHGGRGHLKQARI